MKSPKYEEIIDFRPRLYHPTVPIWVTLLNSYPKWSVVNFVSN